jgi:anion-transporting  ArsA/GET3 family ATPase
MASIVPLFDKRLVLCLGPGGVGKTTTSAALALAGAAAGRRAAVITVDPARRLKDTLGLRTLTGDPQRVRVNRVTEFEALALDTKRIFDALVERFAPSPEVAARVRANRLYHELSNELAGSAEYMAMEKLHELLEQASYQFLVVDTPPSTHARDLLAAPNRLSNLLASRAVSVLKAPSSLLTGRRSRIGRAALSALLRALQRWSGLDLLADLSDFVGGFEDMLDGFRQRATDINRILRAPTTAFVLVTTLDSHTIETTVALSKELTGSGFPVAGVIANRLVSFTAPNGLDASLRGWAEPLRSKLRANYLDLAKLSERDRLAIGRLKAETGLSLLGAVPATTSPPASLAGLRWFAKALSARARRR